MTDSNQSSSPKVRFVTVDADRAGQRVDNYLLTFLKGAPKSLIYKILRKGEVRVNKGRVKPTYRLEKDDVVRIPPIKLSEEKSITPSTYVLDQIQQSIIYEDEGIVVLNKPSGLAVHGGSGISYGVIEAIRSLKDKYGTYELVHRLDRDTSGCLVVAKKRSALRRMHELMREGQINKVYLALCKGVWEGRAREVNAPLRKNTLSSGERIVRVSADGKDARSRFTPKQRFVNATLMEVKLYTGRTHQIRVHAQHEGHVIAGDSKYGDREFSKALKTLGLNRLFLHAHSLSFPWGDDGTMLNVVAPLPEELSSVLNKLTKK